MYSQSCTLIGSRPNIPAAVVFAYTFKLKYTIILKTHLAISTPHEYRDDKFDITKYTFASMA